VPEPELAGDDLRGLEGADERARIDVIEGGRARLRRRARLGAPGVVQRDVGGSLDPALQVPVGLAVADEGDEGHVSSSWSGEDDAVDAAMVAEAQASARVGSRLTMTMGSCGGVRAR
jgi:hypothetical protein